MKSEKLRTVLGFIKKEFAQVLRDPRMRAILFLIPLFQMTLFGYAITTEIKNVKLATIYNPDDFIFRAIEEKCFSSKWFVPAGVQGILSEKGINPIELLKKGSADAVLIAPEGGLTKAIQRGYGKVQLLIDATNIIRAQSIERYIQSIATDVIQRNLNLSISLPINFDVRVLYNSALESPVFMVPGVMAMILCVVTILLTSMSIAKEKELGTMEMIIASPVQTWEILLGKTVPFIIIGLINAITVFLLAVLIFKVPMRGNFLHLAFAAFAFVITTVSIGTLISTFSKSQQQAMMGGFIFLFLANLLAGIMFPIENMPLAMRIVAYINPLTYFVSLLRNIMLKGGAPDVVWKFTAILLTMSFASIFISYKRFKHTLN